MFTLSKPFRHVLWWREIGQNLSLCADIQSHKLRTINIMLSKIRQISRQMQTMESAQ